MPTGKRKTFAVTPPLFVSEPASENTLRIIYAGWRCLPIANRSLHERQSDSSVSKTSGRQQRPATGYSVTYQAVCSPG